MRYRKGDRVQSRRWSDAHGTVVRTFSDGESVGVRFDGTTFTEVEVPVDELWPSTRPAPR